MQRIGGKRILVAMMFASSIAGIVALGPATAEAAGRPADVCRVLRDLQRGRVELPPSTNEFVGHIASLEAVRSVAPDELKPDFDKIINTFAAARDATGGAGLGALIAFQGLTDPQLAAAEGRIAEYAAANCKKRFYGDPSWAVSPPGGATSACEQWRAGSPLLNNRFPYLLDTSAANYFSIVLRTPSLPIPIPGALVVPNGGRVEFKGKYPEARYFAFHPNDISTNNLATLRDVDLDPDPGSKNPWREPVAPGDPRHYTAVLDFGPRPATPAPNTSYVGTTKDGAPNPFVTLLLRTYGSFAGALPPNSAGVPLPAITVYDAAGAVVQEVAACDPYPAGFVVPVDATRFPSFPIPDYRTIRYAGKLTRATNFGLSIDVLANADVFYMNAYFRRGVARQDRRVFVVRAQKPTTTIPALDEPRDDPTKQARLFTICSYNFWNGVANDCKSDLDVVSDGSGAYTVVVSALEDRPRNATAANGITWMSWGPFLDGFLNWRFVFKDDALPLAMGAALDTGVTPQEVAPYMPQTAHCPPSVFERRGVDGCFTWSGRHFR